MPETGSATSPRPMRADARRNYQRLLAVARTAFAERGPEASLDDIARRAGVGPGTLYRHFPTRLALLEAVYRDDVSTLCARADELQHTHPPAQALAEWLQAFVGYAVGKRGLTAALREILGDRKNSFFLECGRELKAAAGRLLDRAQQAGVVRADVQAIDLLRLVHGIVLATEQGGDDIGQADRLLTVVLDGLRPPATNSGR
jgi:AcrR family transcriptional regulator